MLPVNGPTQSTAIISGPAGSMGLASASTQKTTTPNQSSLRRGTDSFWWAIWCRFQADGTIQPLVSKGGPGTTSPGEYAIFRYSDNTAYFDVCQSAGVYAEAQSAALSSATNYLLFAYFDAIAKRIYLRVNHGTINSASWTGTIQQGTSPLEFGHFNYAGERYADSYLGPVMCGVPQPGFRDWDKLSATLYANGSGLDLVRRMPLPYPPGRPLIGVEPIVWCEADYGTYQTSGGSAATADGDPVGQVLDRSVFGNHLLQATSAKRPTLKLSVLNGYPVLRFDGVDDFLMTAAFAGVVSQPNTIFCVANVASVAGATFLWAGSTARNDFLLISGTIDMFAGSDTSAGTYITGGWAIYTGQFNGASSFSRVNGTQSANVNPGSQGLSRLAVGAYSDGSNVLNGDIAAVFVYPGALTAAQITQVESYLNNKYQVY